MSGGAARPDLSRRLAAEAAGTALLLATVVGSGTMGERLAASNVAVAPLANTLATGRRARRAHPDVRPGPADAPGFIVAQLLGAAATTGLFRWLVPALPKSAPTS